MRKLSRALFILILISYPAAVFPQFTNIYTFSGDVDLGVDYTLFQSSGQHYISARGDTVYVVTSDGGNVVCQKSTDGGQSFGFPVIVNTIADAGNPSMRVDTAGVVYVAYQLNADIYFSKSIDGGASFTPGVKVNDDTIPQVGQEKPSIVINNKGQIFIVWRDQRKSAPHTHQTVFVSVSYDGGLNFGTNVQVNDSLSILGETVDIGADDNGHVYVVWITNQNSLALARSEDSAITFGNPTVVNSDLNESATIAVGIGMVAIAWGNVRFVNTTEVFTVYFSISSDFGITFSPPILIDSSSPARNPSLVWKQGKLYLSWQASHVRSDSLRYLDIFFSHSFDGGSTFAPRIPTNFDSFSSHCCASTAVNENGKVFVAWLDRRHDPFFGLNWHTFVA
ncbi:MAG TPA: sialidase family protein, partial [candidate division Zixibacteria bacterium]|nr:sialidase family protein [candidate division Zixibacteria bacterium]